MESKILSNKKITTTFSIADLNIDIQNLNIPLDNNQKKDIVKKILDLPDNFDDFIDFTILNNEEIIFSWILPQNSIKAENFHKQAIKFAREGNIEEAIVKWVEAANENLFNPDYFFNLGVAYFEIKKYIEAIDALTRALAICPIYYRAYLILGVSYLKIRKFENAKKHIEKSLFINKNNKLAYLSLGAIHSILKDYQNGTLMFDKVVSLFPKEANAYMGLAKIYLTLEETDKAIFYFKKVIEYDQKGHLANYAKRSIASMKKGQIANNNLDTNADPEDIYSEGYRNYIIGNFDNSINLYKQYLNIKANDDFVWAALGEVQLRVGKADLAAEAFKKAANISPAKELYFKELAIAFDRLQMYDKVIAALTKAKELGKSDTITNCIWGKALLMQNKIGDSITYLEAAIKKNKNNLLAKYFLGIALEKNGEINEAIGIFDEIISSNADSPIKEKAEKLQKKLLQK